MFEKSFFFPFLAICFIMVNTYEFVFPVKGGTYACPENH